MAHSLEDSTEQINDRYPAFAHDSGCEMRETQSALESQRSEGRAVVDPFGAKDLKGIPVFENDIAASLDDMARPVGEVSERWGFTYGSIFLEKHNGWQSLLAVLHRHQASAVGAVEPRVRVPVPQVDAQKPSGLLHGV